MAKKNKDKEKNPYYVDMDIDMEGLLFPKDQTPASLFIGQCISAFYSFAAQRWGHLQGGASENKNPARGLPMDIHRRLWSLRDSFEEAVKTQETNKAKIEYDDFRTLWDVWNKHEPDPDVNELTRRVELQLKDAISRHDRKEDT